MADTVADKHTASATPNLLEINTISEIVTDGRCFCKTVCIILYQLREIVTEYYLRGYYLLYGGEDQKV